MFRQMFYRVLRKIFGTDGDTEWLQPDNEKRASLDTTLFAQSISKKCSQIPIKMNKSQKAFSI